MSQSIVTVVMFDIVISRCKFNGSYQVIFFGFGFFKKLENCKQQIFVWLDTGDIQPCCELAVVVDDKKMRIFKFKFYMWFLFICTPEKTIHKLYIRVFIKHQFDDLLYFP